MLTKLTLIHQKQSLMKKLLLVLLMAGLTAGASAQQKTYFGIKGGLNMTNISDLKITPDENPTPGSSYVDAKINPVSM